MPNKWSTIWSGLMRAMNPRERLVYQQIKHKLLCEDVNKYRNFVLVAPGGPGEPGEQPRTFQSDYIIKSEAVVENKRFAEDPEEVFAKFVRFYNETKQLIRSNNNIVEKPKKKFFSNSSNSKNLKRQFIRAYSTFDKPLHKNIPKEIVEEEEKTKTYRSECARPVFGKTDLAPGQIMNPDRINAPEQPSKSAIFALANNAKVLREQYRRLSDGVKGRKIVHLMHWQPEKITTAFRNHEIWQSIHNNHLAKLFGNELVKNRKSVSSKPVRT